MADRRKVVAIVQARMTSTRLPGKVLADVCGRPMLEHQLRRLRRAATVDAVVVATTVNPSDDPVCELARALGVACYRGSEADVLSRYAEAAAEHGADVVVRITADCPLLDPGVVDAVVGEVLADPACDYASNVLERSYPQGLDVEALRADTLARVARDARSPMAREHVTWHIVSENPGGFALRSVVDGERHDDLRWTVDTAEDLEMVRRVYEELDLAGRPRGYREILAHVLARPELSRINAHVRQKHM